MEAVLRALISQLNSSVFVLLALLVIVGYGLFKIGEWKKTFSVHEKSIDGLHSMSSTVVELKTKVDLIYQIVNPNSPVRTRSPISLTEVGEEIAGKINAAAIIDKCATKLKKEVDSTNPKNAYDIQIQSMRVAKEKLLPCLDEKELNIVKQEAFNRGLLVEDILSVFGVLLRNRILTERNIPISEVDQHEQRPGTRS